ncbi:hypothetical protein ACFRAR_16315 [Kitasatospora sp. NPDC056651]|uniref:hypothetical protein n=1 Tax=Kitasatospora sp. NPDC056651 TaxID=3345892 RepID=UPI0036CEC862
MTVKDLTAQECSRCRELDAIACAALRVADSATGYCYRDASRLSDVRVLRERHAPYCEHPRGGGHG